MKYTYLFISTQDEMLVLVTGQDVHINGILLQMGEVGLEGFLSAIESPF